MNKLLRLNFVLITLASLSVSCAKEISESSEDVEKRYLESHVKVMYNDTLEKTTSGIYIISMVQGTGLAVDDTSGVYVRYSTMDLKKNYLSTNNDSIAKIIGTYADSTYFGPKLFQLGDYSLIKGIEETLLKMREGGRIKVIIPTWLSNYNYTGSSYTLSTPTIYDIEVLKVVRSVAQFQIDTLEAYSKKHYRGIDSIVNGFYCKKLEEGIGDTLKVDEYVSFWYVARLLDGFVVDTNIEDTARKYRIYNSNRSDGYAAMTHTITDPKTSSSSGTLIRGMDKALLNMKHGGISVAFFNSDWGYGSSAKSFGRYQPLVYWIKVVSDGKDDIDDDDD